MTSLAAFALDLTRAAVVFTTAAVIGDYRAENIRLRAEVARLTDLLDELQVEKALYAALVDEAFVQCEAAKTVIRRIETEERDR